MKTFFNKKIIFKIVTLSLMFSIFFSLLSIPNQAKAVDIVNDPVNLVQNTSSALSAGVSAAASKSIEFKEFVLDGLATMFAKQIIRQITNSIVSWINSGFKGSPSFLQNPGSFFLDVADQITGEFLATHGGPLNALCSPFNINIRLALSLKYHPNIPKKYTCTLGKIISNTKDAINGFTAGNFSQGGWPAFVSLTTEPQNNVYGAYLTADSELSLRVANAQLNKKDEISNGKGFLSWRDPSCAKSVTENNKTIIDYNNDAYISNDYNDEGADYQKLQSVNDCPIQTPGSVIAGTLQNHLDGPLKELQLADELNEIVNALFAQLATQVLTKGLSSVSTQNSSGSTYLKQTVAEFNSQSSPQLQGLKSGLVDTSIYKKNAQDYKQNRDAAVTIMTDIRNNYQSAIACYTANLASKSSGILNSKTSIYQSNITEINSIISTQVDPKITSLTVLAQEASAKVKTLQDIEDKANNAKSIDDINSASQQYAKLLQSNGLINANDIAKSSTDLTTIKEASVGLQQDASNKVQTCRNSN